MFSPLDTSEAQEWFRRFDAALRRLPAEERTQMQLEVRQHLEALATVNEELGHSPEQAWEQALAQFGDPMRIGRKIYQEWLQGRTGDDADKEAIGFAYHDVLIVISGAFILSVLLPMELGYSHIPDAVYAVIWKVIGFGGVLWAGIVIGRSRPLQAINAAFCSSLQMVGFWAFFVILFAGDTSLNKHLSMIVHFLLLGLAWSLGCSAVAYLASVTKRGWYRPSLADFKLTLPRKRVQTSR